MILKKEGVPLHTKTWLIRQPLWYDRDLLACSLISLTVGIIVGVMYGL
jgi:hypothetical protein